MKLFIIRHAETINNQLYESTGSWKGRSEDTELTPKGHIQSDLLAKHFTMSINASKVSSVDYEYRITHLYCSLMLRSVQTANYVANDTGLPLTAWVEWHENGGIYLSDYDIDGKEFNQQPQPGKNREFFSTHYPNLKLPDNLGKLGWWYGRSYETHEQSCIRAKKTFSDLLNIHGNTDHNVAVVTHRNFYNIFMRTVLSIPDGIDVGFSLNNTGVTCLDIKSIQRIQIVFQNRINWLPLNLIS